MSDNRIVTVTLHTALDRVVEAPGLAVGAHIHASEVVCYPGGKGVNVSVTLDRLGVANQATGFVGREEGIAAAAVVDRKSVV